MLEVLPTHLRDLYNSTIAGLLEAQHSEVHQLYALTLSFLQVWIILGVLTLSRITSILARQSLYDSHQGCFPRQREREQKELSERCKSEM